MPAPPVLQMSFGPRTRELITQRRCPCGTTGRKSITHAQALSLGATAALRFQPSSVRKLGHSPTAWRIGQVELPNRD